jgi:hypothetical protein
MKEKPGFFYSPAFSASANSLMSLIYWNFRVVEK